MALWNSRGPPSRCGSGLLPDHAGSQRRGLGCRIPLCSVLPVMLSRPVKLWRFVTSTGPSADMTKKQVPLASGISPKYILMCRDTPDRISKKPAKLRSPLSFIQLTFSGVWRRIDNFRQFSVAAQGSTTSTPVPLKCRTLRVTRTAPRERHMAAIWQSASPIGRPAWRRSAAISA